jgi:hypothetical protein
MIEAALIPNISVGDLKIGSSITTYLKRAHVFYSKKDEFLEDMYTFTQPPVDVFVNDDKIISMISCSNKCIWKNKNLIGLNYQDFVILASRSADSCERLYLVANYKGRNQIAYTFDDLGLQVWVWKNRIVTVSCGNYFFD